MIFVDTDIVVHVLRRRSLAVDERLLHAFDQGSVCLSTVVLFELRYGIAKSGARERQAARLADLMRLPFEVIPFDAHDAARAGELRAILEANGTPIGAYDLMIAAQATARDAVLATGNTREFLRVPGLALESWGE